jgi:lysophospholipase L1-like esterase
MSGSGDDRDDEAADSFRFDFGTGDAADGYAPVTPETEYESGRGYGWVGETTPASVDRGGADPLRRDLVTAAEPFWFSVDVPEGNYRVTVTLGDPASATRTTVKAESRRLFLERVATDPGEFRTEQFTVNVRTTALPGGGSVRLNDREVGTLHWDDRLTLEFGDAHPGVCAVEVEPVADATTVFLAGDSTVTDQPDAPWNSWGQMITRFFGPGVAVANHAESGETVSRWFRELRWEKVRGQLREGDYLFVQFGHNDMKNGTPGESGYYDGVHELVDGALARGVTPVVVTSPHRRRFEGGEVVNTLEEYPETAREIARTGEVPLIDLNRMSATLYEALGPDGSSALFVDGTHFTDYGSYQLARCVLRGIRECGLDLADHVREGVGEYDPATPDPTPAEWRVPDVTPDPHLDL